jgi:2-polyprenyl-3-methyl-5-hydroxy-6-metoxy-1,4-benzoquinol methylase
MSDDQPTESRILVSWQRNSAPWTTAIREAQVESRTLVTNAAVVEAVLSRRPRTVLDLGCGEGWLVRALAAHGIRATGVDAIPSLIEEAKRAGGGEFLVASYEDIAAGALELKVDAVVANFSLIGKESVEGVLRSIPRLLSPDRSLIIQTLHPIDATGDQPYQDGWRQGSWAGFSSEFSDPAPWYFRTVESWEKLIDDSGFQLAELREPLHPATGKPASIIFIASPASLATARTRL